jgi:inner membrane protein
LPVFDPFLFAAHLLAIFLWGVGAADPRAIFPLLYVLLAGYLAWRTLLRARLVRTIPRADAQDRPDDRYTLLPTASPFRWNVVKRSKDGLLGIGEWDNGKLRWLDTMTCDAHPAAEASKALPDVQAFLGITPFPCASVKERSWGYEVRWEDIRYRYRRQYPFVAVVLMDFACVPLQSYVGWLNDERLEKRLRMSTY